MQDEWEVAAMSMLGSIAFALFVAFPLYPLLYLSRLLSQSRTRAPLLVLAMTAQTVSFVALAAWFTFVAPVVLQPVMHALGHAGVPGTTFAMVLLAGLMRTWPGAIASAAVSLAVVRWSGCWLSARWPRRRS
jgi:hypothetical protein